MTQSTVSTLKALTVAGLMGVAAAQAATIVITSRDPAGVGFNDTTVVAPVGGNPGTTLGQQRLNVYRAAANIWEANLQSNVTITVSAGWEALNCTANSATLGSAGAWNIWSDFTGGVPATWYPQALANKLFGTDIPTFVGQLDDGSGYGNVDIKTQFNVNLGKPGCLTGTPFYLGLDGNAGAQVNFMTTLLHELGHGLGFSVLTVNTATGSRFLGLPSIWEGFMQDTSTGKTWLQMTNAERAASTLNFRRLAWNGANATAGVPNVLSLGVPVLAISGINAGSAAGQYEVGTASFGPALNALGVTGELMPVVSNTTAAGATGPGCGPLTALDALAVNGKIAMINRGVCGFAVKTKNAQNAGAIGVVIADNQVGSPAGLGGADPTVTIPAVRISLADANAIRVRLATRSRTHSGVFAKLGVNGSQYAGADLLGRPLLYTPNPRIGGSSVSHWDTIATRNLLMEPSINADLTTSLIPPQDLTLPLLKDMGW